MRAHFPPADTALLAEHFEHADEIARVRTLIPSFAEACLEEAARFAHAHLAPFERDDGPRRGALGRWIGQNGRGTRRDLGRLEHWAERAALRHAEVSKGRGRLKDIDGIRNTA